MTADFRRRCGWCGIPLTWPRLNLCRPCKQAVDANSGVPYAQGSRWNCEPAQTEGTQP